MTVKFACREDVDDILDAAFAEGAEGVRIVSDRAHSCAPCGNRSHFRCEYLTAEERKALHAEAQAAEAARVAAEARQAELVAKAEADAKAAAEAAARNSPPAGSGASTGSPSTESTGPSE